MSVSISSCGRGEWAEDKKIGEKKKVNLDKVDLCKGIE